MAYDEKLAARMRAELAQKPGYSELRMCGGLCFLLHGNMACSILKDGLLVRVGCRATRTPWLSAMCARWTTARG